MRTVELMPIMAEKGVRFDYCTLIEGQGELDSRIAELGGRIYTCPLKPFWSFGRRLTRFLEQTRYDIVHSHSHYFSGYIVRQAHKAGIKGRIVHFRNTFDDKSPTLYRKFYLRTTRKWISVHATAMLAVCRGAMELSWRKDWRQDPRCRVIYNGLDLSNYKGSGNYREDVRRELGLCDDSKLIINVARFIRLKGHDIFIDAAARILSEEPALHFLLVGDGELSDVIKLKTRELGIDKQVHFLGKRSDVPRLLMASDCFVLPSRFEGLPGVVLESLAAQLPVVATNLPGVREIAEHTDLISIVSVEDSDAICKEVLKIVRNDGIRRRAEHPFPQMFDLSHCAENLFEIYKEQVGCFSNIQA